MNETLKIFYRKKQVKWNIIRAAVKLTVKSKIDFKKDIKKLAKKSRNVLHRFEEKQSNKHFFSQFLYTLRFSWVMNHDFDVHVVNSTIKHSFEKKTKLHRRKTKLHRRFHDYIKQRVSVNKSLWHDEYRNKYINWKKHYDASKCDLCVKLHD